MPRLSPNTADAEGGELQPGGVEGGAREKNADVKEPAKSVSRRVAGALSRGVRSFIHSATWDTRWPFTRFGTSTLAAAAASSALPITRSFPPRSTDL